MINKIIYISLTALLIIGSCLAGMESIHNTSLYDLYNQQCWVGFCIFIAILLFDLKHNLLGGLWCILLLASINEFIEQYAGVNDGKLRGADYINFAFIVIIFVFAATKTLRKTKADKNHS